jgi:hypothetical protein
VEDFLLSPSWAPSYCSQDSSVTANFTAANVAGRVAAIEGALRNVHTAMANAGYSDANYSIVVQDYPSPIPYSSGFRYSQSGFTRQNTGGCGFWDADANWANGTALYTIDQAVQTAAAGAGLSNVATLDLSSAFTGRRLCENTVGLLEEQGLPSWTAPGAMDRTEWINQIRTVTTIGSDYYTQESLHPNFWGQLALRSCLRQLTTRAPSTAAPAPSPEPAPIPRANPGWPCATPTAEGSSTADSKREAPACSPAR